MAGRLSKFSAGYYAITLRPTSYEDGPVVDSQLYAHLEDTVYANTNTPVWLRAGFDTSPYFKLTKGEPMPHDMIGLPSAWMEDFDMATDTREQPFFVCKPSHAHYLEQSSLLGNWAGGEQ